MVLRITYFSLLTFLLNACSNQDESSNLETERPLTGKELFIENCANCHGVDGKLGNSGAKDLSVSKLNKDQIRSIIENGQNAMPPLKEIIGSDENISVIVDYTKSLKK